MNLLLFFVFLIIGGGLFLISYKHYKDVLNPLGIFSIIWFSSIGISQLMLSEVQRPWSPSMWFVVLGSGFCFIIGNLSYSFFANSTDKPSRKLELKNHYSKQRLKIIIIVIFLLSLAAYLFEIYKFGGIPLFTKSRIAAYMTFGVRFVHYLTVSSILVCILVYLYQKLFFPEKKLLLNVLFIVSLFIIISNLATGQLIIILVGIFTIKNYLDKKRFKLKSLIILFIIATLILVLLTGFIRSSHSDVAYIKQIGKPIIEIPDRLSPLFLPYLYISTSFENLQLEIEQRDEFYYGTQTSFPIWAFTFLKGYFQSEYYITPEGFNVGTYLRPYFADFGFLGVMIIPFLLGLIITIFYYSLRLKPTILKILIYSLFIYGLIIIFFANAFSETLTWYFLILFIIIDLYCRKDLIPQKTILLY